VKEKLQFTEEEALNLKVELKALDAEVNIKRDSVPLLKNVNMSITKARDKLKAANTLLKQKHGLLGNEQLLNDYALNIVAS
jgi:predicted nuclease with TOPRIM domain